MENNINEIINEIKKRIDIVEFIGSFIQVKKAGKNLKAICPFHQEKTPSFIISPERQIWRCFGGCQEGGDVIKFLMKWENITFFEALKELAEKAGVKLQNIGLEDNAWKKKERLILMNLWASKYYQYILNKTDFGKKALDYLNQRKIHKEIAKKFNLGYALNSWNGVLQFLKKKKFEEEEIHEVGLTVLGDRGNYYDRFRGRLMFPIKDPKGNTIGFSGRIMDSSKSQAKYINTPETPLYLKRETLYGIDIAKEAIKNKKNAILVEGEFDVISPYQYGIENIVAIKGSAITREQLMLLKRYTQKITLALDRDLTGEEAMKRGIEEAVNYELEVNIAIFDFAKDPDEAAHKDLKRLEESFQHSLPLYDFIIELALKKNDSDNPFSKKRIADEVLPFIERINNPIIKSHYIKKIADILKVDKESIDLLMRSYEQKVKRIYRSKIRNTDNKSINRELMIQKYLLSFIFQDKNILHLLNKTFKILCPDDFFLPSHQKLIAMLIKFKDQVKQNDNSNQFTNAFVSFLPKELQPVFDEIYLFASTETNLENKSIEKLVYEIKKNALKKKIGDLLSLEKSQTPEMNKKIAIYSLELKELEKKLLTL